MKNSFPKLNLGFLRKGDASNSTRLSHSGSHDHVLNQMLGSIRPSLYGAKQVSRASEMAKKKYTASHAPQLTMTLKDIRPNTLESRRKLFPGDSSSLLVRKSTVQATLAESSVMRNRTATGQQNVLDAPYGIRNPANTGSLLALSRHISEVTLDTVSLNESSCNSVDRPPTTTNYEKGDYLTESQFDLFLCQQKNKTQEYSD